MDGRCFPRKPRRKPETEATPSGTGGQSPIERAIGSLCDRIGRAENADEITAIAAAIRELAQTAEILKKEEGN